MVNNDHKNIFKVVLITIFIFITYYLLIYYPMMGDVFDYWHMKKVLEIISTGNLNFDMINIGYYTITSEISIISGLSPDFIPKMPILLFIIIPQIFCIMFTLVNKENCHYDLISILFIILLSMICYVTWFGNYSSFAWWSHGIGFALCLTSIIIIIKIIILKILK